MLRTMLWSIYNFDGDQAGSCFGAKQANRPLHAIYAYDTHTITVDNLGAGNADNLSVQARVLDIAGDVLDDQSRGGLSLASQEVRNRVLTLRIPATTQPPAPGQTSATYRAQDLNGAEQVVSLFGWNTRRMLLAAPRHD